MKRPQRVCSLLQKEYFGKGYFKSLVYKLLCTQSLVTIVISYHVFSSKHNKLLLKFIG